MIGKSCLVNSTENNNDKGDGNNLRKSFEYFNLDYLLSDSSNELLLINNQQQQQQENNNQEENNKIMINNRPNDLELKLLNKSEVERLNILKEILSSEKKYLNDLQEIIEVFLVYT